MTVNPQRQMVNLRWTARTTDRTHYRERALAPLRENPPLYRWDCDCPCGCLQVQYGDVLPSGWELKRGYGNYHICPPCRFH